MEFRTSAASRCRYRQKNRCRSPIKYWHLLRMHTTIRNLLHTPERLRVSIDPKHTYKTFGVAALIALLAGCSTMPRDILKPTDVEKTYDADMPRPTFNYDEAVTEIPIFDDLVPQRLDRSEAIPRMVIGGVSASGRTSAEALLLALLAGTRMSATFDGAAARKTGFVATRLSGQLETIVDDIADRLDIWYSYRGGVFRFKESERFSVKVPPVFTPEQTTAIENTLKAFGAADIIFDPSTYLLMYRASPGEQDAIEQYLEVLRSREMLVYDVYVYEVALSDSAALGINWQQFNYQRGDGSLSLNGGSLASNALSLTGTFAGDNFSLTQLVTFLQSQGSVRTVSQPKISVMTGQTASFVVGQIERILSKVGATVGSGFSTVTTETEDLETGLRVLLRGGCAHGLNLRYFSSQSSSTASLMFFISLWSLKRRSARSARISVHADVSRSGSEICKSAWRRRRGEARRATAGSACVCMSM